jgi:hypothetical protein
LTVGMSCGPHHSVVFARSEGKKPVSKPHTGE